MTRREWGELAEVIRLEVQSLDIRVDAGTIDPQVAMGGYQMAHMLAVQLAAVLSKHHARFEVKAFLRACGYTM